MKRSRHGLGGVSMAGAVAGAVLGLAALLFWFFGAGLATQPLTSPRSAAPFIHLQPEQASGLSQLEQEMALLDDPAPLFLPTSWNYLVQAQEQGSSLPETPELFVGFGARLLLEGRAPEPLPRLVGEVAYSSPQDALRNSDWSYFVGFGEKDEIRRPALPPRRAAYRLSQLSDGLREVGGVVELRPDDPVPPADWRPVEFLLMVDLLGPVGQPLGISSSGHEEWDRTLERWVRESRFWTDLDPGYYLLSIGP